MNLSVAVSNPTESGLKNKLNFVLQLLHCLWKLDTSSAELLLEDFSACLYIPKVL
jgi:hypothetical protein